ncbi:MAG: hypothetical protein FWD27_05070 [Coriobacteriia bacterium]|nr:hypothetical protein [Coriobacteriia bacterium]
MATFMYIVCAVAQAILAVIAIRLYMKDRAIGTLMLVLPIAAVVWDNTIVALGATIGEGSLLMALSWPRYIGHALFTPAWIVAGVSFAQRSGAQWLNTKAVNVGQWVLYAVCVVLGFLRSVVFLNMELVAEGGLLYYRNASGFPGPPFGSVIMLFVVLACAVIVWRKIKSPWMFLGSLFMLISVGVPAAVIGFDLTNLGEVVMAASLVYTGYVLLRQKGQPKKQLKAAPPGGK